MTGGNAHGQLVVTFSKEELPLLEVIKEYSQKTGAGKSGATKLMLRAALGDKDAKAVLETLAKDLQGLKELQGFSGAALRVARKQGHAAVA